MGMQSQNMIPKLSLRFHIFCNLQYILSKLLSNSTCDSTYWNLPVVRRFDLELQGYKVKIFQNMAPKSIFEILPILQSSIHLFSKLLEGFDIKTAFTFELLLYTNALPNKGLFAWPNKHWIHKNQICEVSNKYQCASVRCSNEVLRHCIGHCPLLYIGKVHQDVISFLTTSWSKSCQSKVRWSGWGTSAVI